MVLVHEYVFLVLGLANLSSLSLLGCVKLTNLLFAHVKGSYSSLYYALVCDNTVCAGIVYRI